MTNCPRITAPGIDSLSSSAFAIAPFIPFAPSVSSSFAPYACRSLRLSTLIVSGRVKMALYPLAAATAASPIPVLPLVGSMIVDPSFSIPFSSASRIMPHAILSLTEPAGFRYSSFTSSSPPVIPAAALYLDARSSGVPPISSSADSFIFDILFSIPPRLAGSMLSLSGLCSLIIMMLG